MTTLQRLPLHRHLVCQGEYQARLNWGQAALQPQRLLLEDATALDLEVNPLRADRRAKRLHFQRKRLSVQFHGEERTTAPSKGFFQFQLQRGITH